VTTSQIRKKSTCKKEKVTYKGKKKTQLGREKARCKGKE